MRTSILWFCLLLAPFTLIRVALLALQGDDFANLVPGQVLIGFFQGLRFDLSSVAIFTLIPLVAWNLPLAFAQKAFWRLGWGAFLTLEGILFVAVLVGDLAYYPYVKRHLSYELQLLEGDWGLVAQMAFKSFLPYLAAFFVLAFALALLGHRIARLHDRYVLRWSGLLALFLLLVVLARGSLGDKPIGVIDAFTQGNAQVGQLSLNGIFAVSHDLMSFRSLKRNHMPQDKAEKLALGGAAGRFPLMRHYPGREGKKPNLVYILVESLSNRYLGPDASGFSLTPNLDALAKESVWFTQHYASGQRSLEGIQVALTGLPALKDLPNLGSGLNANSPGMGHMLQQNGYDTLYVQAMKRASFKGESIAGHVGFQRYFGKEDMPLLLNYPDPDESIFGWDHETFQLTLDKIKGMKRPFGAFVVTSSTHTPYFRLPNNLARFPHDPETEDGFKNSMIYFDWALGEFLQAARTQDWFEDTLFVITADHAQPHYSKGANILDFFRTPLILYYPKALKPEVRPEIASQLEVLPTLVDLLGLRGDWGFWGQSLLSERKHPQALMRNGNLMIIVGKEGYVRHSMNNRVEGMTFGATEKQDLRNLEKRLLAMDQIMLQLIQENRWQQPGP